MSHLAFTSILTFFNIILKSSHICCPNRLLKSSSLNDTQITNLRCSTNLRDELLGLQNSTRSSLYYLLSWAVYDAVWLKTESYWKISVGKKWLFCSKCVLSFLRKDLIDFKISKYDAALGKHTYKMKDELTLCFDDSKREQLLWDSAPLQRCLSKRKAEWDCADWLWDR